MFENMGGVARDNKVIGWGQKRDAISSLIAIDPKSNACFSHRKLHIANVNLIRVMGEACNVSIEGGRVSSNTVIWVQPQGFGKILVFLLWGPASKICLSG